MFEDYHQSIVDYSCELKSMNIYYSFYIDEEKQAKSNQCIVVIKNLSSFQPYVEQDDCIYEDSVGIRKEKKHVKGVEEQIFYEKFRELYEYLDSIHDDDWIFIAGKKKANYYKHDRRTKRRSGYRGVSRNGASWQVLMMINNVKTYIGWYKTEEEGALVYDIVSILFKLQKARTNLSYSKSKLLDLLQIYDPDTKHFKKNVPQDFIDELRVLDFY